MLTEFTALGRGRTLGEAVERLLAGSEQDFPVLGLENAVLRRQTIPDESTYVRFVINHENRRAIVVCRIGSSEIEVRLHV